MTPLQLTFLCGACLLLSTTAKRNDEVPTMSASAPAFDEDGHPEFESFRLKHGRMYGEGSYEHQERLSHFLRHAAEVEDLNAKSGRRWTASLNHMADWSESEIKALHGLKAVAKSGNSAASGKSGFLSRSTRRSSTLPQEVSWLNLTSISSAVDQGGCGSCWAVTTTRLLASHSEIYAGANRRSFSTQEVVDCSPNTKHCGGKGGCDGSTVTLGMDYIMRHGVATIVENPYQGHDTTCSATPASGESTTTLTNDQIMQPGIHLATDAAVGAAGLAFQMQGWELLPGNQELPLVTALAERGPVAISVDAEPWTWYSSGILGDCNIDAVISHAVLMVGYGQEADGTMYWLIQNSWGSNWGEHGNIRLLRRADEATHCGIDHQPELGSGCDGGPSQVTVCGTCGVLYESVVPHFSHAAPA